MIFDFVAAQQKHHIFHLSQHRFVKNQSIYLWRAAALQYNSIRRRRRRRIGQEDEGAGRIIINENSIASKQQLHIPNNYYLDNDDTVHNNEGSDPAGIFLFFRIRPILLVRHVLRLCHKHRSSVSSRNSSSVRTDSSTEHGQQQQWQKRQHCIIDGGRWRSTTTWIRTAKRNNNTDR